MDSFKLSASFTELIKLALSGKQRTIRITDTLTEPHVTCPIQKEDAKTCYMGKAGVASVADCP